MSELVIPEDLRETYQLLKEDGDYMLEWEGARELIERIARLSAPITAADLFAHGMGYAEGDKQAYAEAFNAIISERGQVQ